MYAATVVVMQSDPNLLAGMEKSLAAEDCRIVRCGTVAELSTKLSQVDADIIVVDAHPPDGDGWELVKDLRRERDCGIVMVSPRDDETDVILGLEFGADDFVAKPDRFRELRARVKAVHRRTAGFSAFRANLQSVPGMTYHTAAGLRIHGGARTVKRPTGEPVDLTTLEFDVLAALASRPNHVFTRAELKDVVRGPGWSSDERIIDGLVSRLRSKLFPEGGGHHIIKTVRGRGYVLVDEDGHAEPGRGIS